jgi:ectoine hydroxylase-related dioxygenase (phytanoyl-CoA dioxygenase family)
MTVTVASVGRLQMDLLRAQRVQFEEDGVLVVRDAVSPETIARVSEASDHIVEEGGPQGRWIGKPVSAKRRVEYRGLFNLDDAFLELLAPPKVFPPMVALLSPNIHVMSSQLLYAHPNQPPRPHHGGWHRDVIGSSEDLGYDRTPRLAIRVGYYLSDVGDEASGVTLFVPGSHRLKRPIPLPRGDRDPERYVRLDIRPGDAVVWENRTFHAPETNTSPNARKAVMVQYGYRWLRPVDYLDHSPELLARCDPVAHQLLSSHDLNDDGSMTRMKGSRALDEWAAEHGLGRELSPEAQALEPK